MDYITARVTLTGTASYSQSKHHDVPSLKGESKEAYDDRTWREKLTVREIDGRRTVVIPSHGIHQALMSAAKYSKKQIPGQGKATWTAKFTSGLMFATEADLGVDPADALSERIYVNSDGIRGSNKRVWRTFPIIPVGWTTTFDIHIIDPIITRDVFEEIFGIAGLYVGIGRFRPEKGGLNGRFTVDIDTWQDHRKLAA